MTPLLVFMGAVVLLHGLGLMYPGLMWGCSFYSFLPHPLFFIATVLLAAATAVTLTRPSRVDVGASVSQPMRSPVPAAIVAGITAATVMWLSRVSHLMLGDGLPLTSSVLAGEWFHPLEPISALLQNLIFSATRSLLAGDGVVTWRTAWDALALGSVIAGGLTASVLWLLSRELKRGPETAQGTTLMTWLLLLTQGYVLIFHGYVENYAFFTGALALYLLCGVRFLHRGGSILAPGLVMVLCAGLHLSGLVLVPSFVVLAATGWRRDQARRRLVLDVGFSAAIAVAIVTAFTMTDASLRWWGPIREALTSLVSPTSFDYLLSRDHLRDYANELILIGPLGLWGLLQLRTMGLRAKHEGADLFVATAAVTYLVASWFAGESNLGYARNWDLLAPAGLVFAVAAVIAGRPTPAPEKQRVLFLLVLLSLFHTVPWIAVNASESAAIRRMAVLPIGTSQAASTIGYWQGLQGRPDAAEIWLTRAIASSPTNARAHYFLGRLRLDQGRFQDAAESFNAAASLRPDLAEFRLRAAESSLRARDYAGALQSLNSSGLSPRDSTLVGLRALALAGLGWAHEPRQGIGSPRPGATPMLISDLSRVVDNDSLWSRHLDSILAEVDNHAGRAPLERRR